MKSQSLKIAVLIIGILSAFVFAVYFRTRNEIASAQTRAAQIKEIEGYRNWTKVNAVPQLMPDIVAMSCVLYRSAGGGIVDPATNPHRQFFITVYVNDIGRKAMLEQKKPKFPEGSVIVKEKLFEAQALSPDLLTVMIKHGKGYNPENGDWEYMVTNGDGTILNGRGNLENCQACHFHNAKTDYIFRTYLSEADSKKLK